MGGLRKYLPITNLTFLITCFAIAGIPPFAGFFSKEEILLASYHSNKIVFVVALLTSGLTAFYMFRLYAMTFLGKFRGTHEQEHHLHESPAAITFPLIILAILAVVGGWIGIPEVFMHGGHRLETFLEPIFAKSNSLAAHDPLSHSTEYFLMGVSVGGSLIALLYALNKYKNYQNSGKEETGIGKVLSNKWYIDELYNAIIVRPVNLIAGFFNNVMEKNVIDGMVNGVGRAVNYGSRQIRLLQNGQVGTYVLLMVFGILALFIIQLFL
jgi:NADH-quinone oxidoreductase subunit L